LVFVAGKRSNLEGAIWMALLIRTPSHRFWSYNGTPKAWFTLPPQVHTRTSTRSGGDVWDPAVTVSKVDGRLRFRVDVEGVDPDDLVVSISPDMLTFSGKHQLERKVHRNGQVVREISRSSFTRGHRLPRSVDWENAEATFEDGVLEVSMDIVDHGPKHIDIRPWRQ